MAKTYTLHVAGLTRELPICPVSDTLDIAAFIMFSDVELTVKTAEALAAKCPECDFVLTAECKGIPLAYEYARQKGIPYIVARKSVKLYMPGPVGVEVKSITTAAQQTLYLDSETCARMKGKRVLILDDVISTGESLHAMVQLVAAAGATLVGQAVVLAEGDAAKRDDILFLEELPLFFH